MEKKYIPYGRQWIDKKDIDAVIKVLRSDWITQGSGIKEFEAAVSKYVGVKYAVAVSSGTAALHSACYAAGIKKGDEVVTSPITFAASANCVLYQSGKPVFADIKKDTCNIDPEDIIRKITRKTKAIIPVDFAGQPADLDEINKIAKKNRLIIIEDAAHALGAEYKGRKIGGFSDMTVFSFHPVKHITTGEGGMVLTNRKDLYERLLLFRTHGITKDRNKLINKNIGAWYYEMQDLGYNYRITDFQCVLGIQQLKRLDGFIRRRREIVDKYNTAFKEVKEIIIPHEKTDAKSSWHIYVIRLRLEKFKVGRKEIFQGLRKQNIGVNVHYMPVYYSPYYKALGYKEGLCPEAEKYYEQAITLPLFPRMEDTDVKRVIKTVKQVIYDSQN